MNAIGKLTFEACPACVHSDEDDDCTWSPGDLDALLLLDDDGETVLCDGFRTEDELRDMAEAERQREEADRGPQQQR
jgi:hypothetical protein